MKQWEKRPLSGMKQRSRSPALQLPGMHQLRQDDVDGGGSRVPLFGKIGEPSLVGDFEPDLPHPLIKLLPEEIG